MVISPLVNKAAITPIITISGMIACVKKMPVLVISSALLATFPSQKTKVMYSTVVIPIAASSPWGMSCFGSLSFPDKAIPAMMPVTPGKNRANKFQNPVAVIFVVRLACIPPA